DAIRPRSRAVWAGSQNERPAGTNQQDICLGIRAVSEIDQSDLAFWRSFTQAVALLSVDSLEPVELPMRGWAVTRCCVDYQFRLILAGPDRLTTEVVLESPFQFMNGEAAADLVPGDKSRVEEFGPVLRLFGRTVERALVDGGGRLQLSLAG